MKNYKAITPVVSMGLILVVAITAVIGFQSWYTSFSSNLLVETETQTNSQNKLKIDSLYDNHLYLLNPLGSDVTIEKIQVNYDDCNIHGNFSEKIIKLDIGRCISEFSDSSIEVSVFSKGEIKNKYFYLDNSNKVNSNKLVTVLSGFADEKINSMVIDSNDNLYLSGYSRGNLEFGDGLNLTNQGGHDLFLVKYNTTFSIEFLKLAGSGSGSGTDYVTTLNIDNQDNIYITGRAGNNLNFGDGINMSYSGGGGDFFITKYNSSGSAQLVISDYANSATGYDTGQGLDLDSSNNMYISGSTYSTIELGNNINLSNDGNEDIFLIKYNSSGIAQLAKSSESNSGTSYDRGYGVKLDAQDNIYLFGNSASNMDFGLGFNYTNQNYYDAYLIKYNTLGVPQLLIHPTNGTNSESFKKVEFDSKGNIYIIGSAKSNLSFGNNITLFHKGNSDLFLAKYNSSGQIQYIITAQNNTGLGNDGFEDLKIDNQDNIFLTGFSNSTLDFGNGVTLNPTTGIDFFLIKVNNLGIPQYIKTSKSNNGDEYLDRLVIDSKGNIFVSGRYTGDVTFDNSKTITNSGEFDNFVYKYGYLAK